VLRAAACAVAASLIGVTPAAAQTTSPPGPWALDVRGVTSPVPDDAAFYPTLQAATVPTRGYGIDVGAHLYLFHFGPSRVGLGGSVLSIRSTTTSTSTQTIDNVTVTTSGQRLTLNMRILAPQISFNFGSRDGWSYLSLGAGAASIDTRTAEVLAGSRDSGWRRALNFGGGARWFFRPHLAFGFDLRIHRISSGAAGDIVLGSIGTVPSMESAPSVTAVSIGAGLSFR
jgi:outer membrane protein with beta-barrel domain